MFPHAGCGYHTSTVYSRSSVKMKRTLIIRLHTNINGKTQNIKYKVGPSQCESHCCLQGCDYCIIQTRVALNRAYASTEAQKFPLI